MADPDFDVFAITEAKTLDPIGTALRVLVWTQANKTGGWDLVLTCRNRDVPDRRLSFASERLAEEAVQPCSMRYMDDIKRSEGTLTGTPPLI